MEAVVMLMATRIKKNKYELDRVPAVLKSQVEQKLSELGDE